MEKDIKIEICCGSYEDAAAAKLAGVDRVELNSALFLGGLTPSLGNLILLKTNVDISVMAMVRPRDAGFLYSDNEYEVMKKDAELLLEHGADGIVFGFLNADGTIDNKRVSEFIEIIGDHDSVFHRAFDVVPEPFAALETLISLGITRVLTSGQKPSAIEGRELIKKLVDSAGGRIEILPGAGIKAENVKQFVEYTNVNQIHFSALMQRDDPSTEHNRQIHFGKTTPPRNDITEYISTEKVLKVIRALHG